MDKTICIFGDSVTQAAYVKESWAELLRQFLEEKYRDSFINVFNLGVGGNTSTDILNRLEKEALARKPTSLVLQFGVNDSGYFRTPNKPIVEESLFRSNVSEIITKAKTIAENITFIGPALGDESLLKPLPGSSKGKTYERVRVEKYNSIFKNAASSSNLKFIELINVLGYEDFMDGLHPNVQGHRKIFDEVLINY